MQDRAQAKQAVQTLPDALQKSKGSCQARKKSQRRWSPQNHKLLSSYCAYASLSFQMMAVMGIAYWAGSALDQYFLTAPALAFILAAGAIVLSIYVLIKKITQM